MGCKKLSKALEDLGNWLLFLKFVEFSFIFCTISIPSIKSKLTGKLNEILAASLHIHCTYSCPCKRCVPHAVRCVLDTVMWRLITVKCTSDSVTMITGNLPSGISVITFQLAWLDMY